MITRLGRSRLVTAAVVVASIVAVALGFLGAVQRGAAKGSPPAPRAPAELPGELVGPAPWPRNVTELRQRLAALGLPALGREGTALHIHQHLDVFANGRRVPVPAGIGIDASGGFISPLHTHDATGIIHVESPTVEPFYLGQFFGVWGVRFTPSCLGAYCASRPKQLWVFADGKRVRSDPRALLLEEHEEIVVAFGTREQLPSPLPESFAFPEGL
jgi:hypothetical protein